MNVNGNAAMLAQLKKVQVSRQQQIQANGMQARPHGLAIVATSSTNGSSQASPASAGSSPSMANGLPVVNGVNGMAIGVNGITSKPTPPPSQPSFPSHLQPPSASQSSQSPNIHDASGVPARPRSKPDLSRRSKPTCVSLCHYRSPA